jgi:Ca-activated chloride channel family protein
MVSVTVTDAMNHPVNGLRREDFSIYEQGTAQQIRYFSEEDTPISVGLILDFSKSMTNKIETERMAVTQFFQNANPEDDYFVITISDRPNLIATSTQSIDALQSELGLAVPDGRTALLDGIYLGVAQMNSARYARRALLIISDGGDNNSHYSLNEIKAIVRESDIAVYAIGLFDTALFKTFEEYMGKKWLEGITGATTGRTLTIDNLANLPAVAANISQELRDQYVLAYKPQNCAADGKWRKIRVRVAAPQGGPPLRAYYKRTYLIPKK